MSSWQAPPVTWNMHKTATTTGNFLKSHNPPGLLLREFVASMCKCVVWPAMHRGPAGWSLQRLSAEIQNLNLASGKCWARSNDLYLYLILKSFLLLSQKLYDSGKKKKEAKQDGTKNLKNGNDIPSVKARKINFENIVIRAYKLLLALRSTELHWSTCLPLATCGS